MATSFRQNLTFPTGRLVWGSISKGRDKDRSGKPLTTKDGKPRTEFTFGVAYEKKGEAAWYQTAWGAIAYTIARQCFPGRFDPQGQPIGKFSFKVVDGDSAVPNENGNKPCDQEGHKNHWVVTFKSSFAPSTWNSNGSLPVDAASIKCGDYVQVAGSIDGNMDAQKPGIYVNHNMVALSGTGVAIVSGPDPQSAGFGQGPTPAAMNQTPVGGLPAVGSAPAPLPQVSAPLPTPIQPHPAILQPPQPPIPIVGFGQGPGAYCLTAKAGGATWEQLKAVGWTEELARQQGIIA